jgi:hypothetical protein
VSFFSRSGRHRSRLPDDVVEMIERAGLHHWVENRSKHFALILARGPDDPAPVTAAIFPHGGLGDRGQAPWKRDNFKRNVRQAAERMIGRPIQ